MLFFVSVFFFLQYTYFFLKKEETNFPEKWYTESRKEAITSAVEEKAKKITEEKQDTENYLRKNLESAKEELYWTILAIENFPFMDEINEQSSKELKVFLEKKKLEVSKLWKSNSKEFLLLEEELWRVSKMIWDFYWLISQAEIWFWLFYLWDVERKNALKEKHKLVKEDEVEIKEFYFLVEDWWFYKWRKFIFLPD